MLQKEDKKSLITQFGLHKSDTGSPAVQIAILTKRIEELTEHLKLNKKDISSRRGLLQMVSRRRKLLITLMREDIAKYEEVIKKLGLKRDIVKLEKLKKDAEEKGNVGVVLLSKSRQSGETTISANTNA